VDSVYDIEWTRGIKYGDVYLQNEIEQSHFNFHEATIDALLQRFGLYEAEARQLLEKKLVFPGFDHVLKCSHTFNLLDARGAISVTERTGYIGRIRKLARQTAQAFLEKREQMGFPLLH
jgi:glycyl-tRNA synthetase alpha chain